MRPDFSQGSSGACIVSVTTRGSFVGLPQIDLRHDALTVQLCAGENVRKLVKDGFVIKKPTVIHSRARARASAEAKSKGRHTGYGALPVIRCLPHFAHFPLKALFMSIPYHVGARSAAEKQFSFSEPAWSVPRQRHRPAGSA